MNKFFREITKELGVNITAFDVPYERIEQNLSLDLKKCRSKSTILEHITKVERQFPHLKKKQLKEKFSNEELRKKLSIILPDLEKNCDSRLKHLLKSNGPFCKIVVKKTHKHHLKKAKGVYFFYNKKTLEPLYIGVAKGSYTRLMSYFSITPSNCMYNGQGTTVRINILINEFLNHGNSIGLAIIPMSISSRTEISQEETRLIDKFRDNEPFWNINS